MLGYHDQIGIVGVRIKGWVTPCQSRIRLRFLGCRIRLSSVAQGSLTLFLGTWIKLKRKKALPATVAVGRWPKKKARRRQISHLGEHSELGRG